MNRFFALAYRLVILAGCFAAFCALLLFVAIDLKDSFSVSWISLMLKFWPGYVAPAVLIAIWTLTTHGLPDAKPGTFSDDSDSMFKDTDVRGTTTSGEQTTNGLTSSGLPF